MIARSQVVDLSQLFTFCLVALKCLLNRIQQILIPKRLSEELDGTRFQGSDGHRNVPMRGDEDYGDTHAQFCQLSLEIKSTHLRQPDIKNQAIWIGGAWFFEKLLAGCKGLGTEADRLDEILNRLTHSSVVINDEHGRNSSGFHACASAPPGRVK